MMRRVGTVVAAVALSLTGLAACSGGDDAYCDKLEGANADLDVEMNPKNLGAMRKQLEKVQGHVKDIRGDAPEDVEKHWKTMDKSIDNLGPALKELGSVGDIASLSREEQAELMEKVDLNKFQQDAGKLVDAGKAIDKDGKERCDLSAQ